MGMVLQNAILRRNFWLAAPSAPRGDSIAGIQRIIFRKALDMGRDLCYTPLARGVEPLAISMGA